MGREFELKYAADRETLAAIRQRFEGFTPISMETTYFDTLNMALSQRKWMLRRRLENGKSVCTLKTPLPDGSRGEWETDCGSIGDALPLLVKQSGLSELGELTGSGLQEVCAARFIRLAAEISLPQCVVELALDEGCFLGGGQELPFAELEVELKSGEETAARVFAQELAKEFNLQPQPRSKVQRALALAGL